MVLLRVKRTDKGWVAAQVMYGQTCCYKLVRGTHLLPSSPRHFGPVLILGKVVSRLTGHGPVHLSVEVVELRQK